MTDPNFQRTRENGSEFGSAASAGKLLRAAIRALLLTTSDNRITSRVTKVMTIVKNFDATSARGLRNVGVAISQAAAKAELKDFDFNIDSPLSTTLFKPYAVNVTTGVITIAGLVPATDISFPVGATHVTVPDAAPAAQSTPAATPVAVPAGDVALMTVTSQLVSISTNSASADAFVVPADFKKQELKTQ